MKAKKTVPTVPTYIIELELEAAEAQLLTGILGDIIRTPAKQLEELTQPEDELLRAIVSEINLAEVA